MIGNTKLSSRVDKVEEKKKQPYKSKNKCFTWNNFPKEGIEVLKKRFTELQAKFIFGEEVGESGTPHLQGYIELPIKMRWTEFKLPKEIHWENSRANKVDNVRYCSKDGKVHTNMRIDKPLKIIDDEKLYVWEKEIISIIDKEPDDRTIHWYWEEKGCAGKTHFCKYLVNKYEALVVSGKSTDAFFGVVSYKEKQGCFPGVLIIDVPRTDMMDFNYACVEKIKDGLFFSGKYESQQVIFNSPHVFVFANKAPYECALSKDRWHIVHI